MLRKIIFVLIILVLIPAELFCAEIKKTGQISGCLMKYSGYTMSNDITTIISGVEGANYNNLRQNVWNEYINCPPVLLNNEPAHSDYFIVGQKGEMVCTPFRIGDVFNNIRPMQLNNFGWRGYVRFIGPPPAAYSSVKMVLYSWTNLSELDGFPTGYPVYNFYETYNKGQWKAEFNCQIYKVNDYGTVDSSDWSNSGSGLGACPVKFNSTANKIFIEEPVGTKDKIKLEITLDSGMFNAVGDTFFEIKSASEGLVNPLPAWLERGFSGGFYTYDSYERIMIRKVEFIFTE